jgi:DNA replication protein DnaC
VVRVKELAPLRCAEQQATAIFLGPPGTGKTHLAVALAMAACQRGFSIYCTTLDDLVQPLKTADHRNQLPHQLKTSLKAAVLVVDEVGSLPLERMEANDLFPLICRRYARGSIIVTRNQAFSEWAELLGDEVLAAAILDRLLHQAEGLPINGPSYRLKDRRNLARAGGMTRTSCALQQTIPERWRMLDKIARSQLYTFYLTTNNLAVVVADTGAPLLTGVPGGVVPHQP